MGKMSIFITEEYTNPSGEGVIGSTLGTNSNCISQWALFAKTSSSVWIEWLITGNHVTISKNAGGTVNGETLTEITEYTITIDAYRSSQGSQNDEVSNITIILRDSDGGSVLDTKVFSRLHTGIQC